MELAQAAAISRVMTKRGFDMYMILEVIKYANYKPTGLYEMFTLTRQERQHLFKKFRTHFRIHYSQLLPNDAANWFVRVGVRPMILGSHRITFKTDDGRYEAFIRGKTPDIIQMKFKNNNDRETFEFPIDGDTTTLDPPLAKIIKNVKLIFDNWPSDNISMLKNY